MEGNQEEVEKRILEAKESNSKTLHLSGLTLTSIPKQVFKLDWIKELNLNSTQIIDLSPLRDLKSLTELGLGENQITDLSPLKDLKSLTKFLSRNVV
jgi:internalin A